MGYSDPVVVLSEIISGHIGGAVQPGSESRQWRQIRWTARCKGASFRNTKCVCTIPDTPSDLDDGLLQASEVAELKLNADWVVLSACPGRDGIWRGIVSATKNR